MMPHPKARQDDLVVQELFEELVVYDLTRNQVHSLNPTAATVWQQCDGQTSPAQLAGRLQRELEPAQAEALVWLALDRLEKAELLEQRAARPGGVRINRRQALRTLGISALLLPVVASMAAPAAAQSWTCPWGAPADVEVSIGGYTTCEDAAGALNSECVTWCGTSNSYAIDCVFDGSNTIIKAWCCCAPD